MDLSPRTRLKRIREVTDDLEVGLLVFNAGANTYGHEFVTGDLDGVPQVIDLNITAQLALVHHFGAPMKARRRGGILLVGSLAGFMGQAPDQHLRGVKAFCRVFAEGLWLEMRDHGVDVVEFVLGRDPNPRDGPRRTQLRHPRTERLRA